jgi:hypothetical protein
LVPFMSNVRGTAILYLSMGDLGYVATEKNREDGGPLIRKTVEVSLWAC